MAHSPWRAALDGQVQVLRSFRKDAVIAHLATQIRTDQLEAYLKKHHAKESSLILIEGARALAEGMGKLVRDSEPVYLTHDILEEVDRRISIRSAKPDGWSDVVLDHMMLPIPSGLIWFGPRGLRMYDPEGSITSRDGETVSKFSVLIRGMYFGFGYVLSVKPNLRGITFEVSSNGPTHDLTGTMGVIVFLDAEQSGYISATKTWGNHLVPVPIGDWAFGETLPMLSASLGRTTDYPVSSKWDEPGTRLLLEKTGQFLYELFLLMLQRVTLWGGVAVHHKESREAEAEKLRPRVQLVTWRKANYQYPEGHIPVPVNWSCRWSVRPHYRRYKNGKTVMIQSYIKGPLDRPFRERDIRAHQVKR